MGLIYYKQRELKYVIVLREEITFIWMTFHGIIFQRITFLCMCLTKN